MTESLLPVCILAGGLGTRLGDRAKGIPKPLIEVAGQPFVLHQLRLLADHGARRVVMCVGYLGEQIAQRLGGEQFGISISYSFDGPQQLGTLGAIRNAVDLLGPRFLVLYGDTYLRIDYGVTTAAWESSGLPAMMTVLCNEDRWDRSNAQFDGACVTAYDKRAPKPEMRWIDYGLGGLEQRALHTVDDNVGDLADLYRVLASRGQLFGFAASHRFYEIGTPAGLDETRAFLSSLA